jgi:hypothetical protein
MSDDKIVRADKTGIRNLQTGQLVEGVGIEGNDDKANLVVGKVSFGRNPPSKNPAEIAREKDLERAVRVIEDAAAAGPQSNTVARESKTLYERAKDAKDFKQKQEGGLRFDDGKNRLDLLPPEWTWALGDVMTRGAKKYAVRNWELGMAWGKVIGCTLRHIAKFLFGERYDPETGCHHMAMAAWNCLTLMTYDIREIGENDLATLHMSMRLMERVNAETTDMGLDV